MSEIGERVRRAEDGGSAEAVLRAVEQQLVATLGLIRVLLTENSPPVEPPADGDEWVETLGGERHRVE